jgi:hypothetical protein
MSNFLTLSAKNGLLNLVFAPTTAFLIPNKARSRPLSENQGRKYKRITSETNI